MGDGTQLEVYRDAVHWLQLAADESSKPGDVDLAKLLACHDCARKLVQRLLNIEQHPVRRSGLWQLMASLDNHQSLFQGRLRQKHGENRGGRASAGDQTDQRRLSIVSSLIRAPGDFTLASCVGLEDVKQLLREAVLLPYTHPHLFSGRRRPWRRLLLYGPPGTGKTLLAHAISSESLAVFYSVSSADILSSWVGESEKLVRDLFSHARQQTSQPVIVLIDEVDSLCRQRSMKEEDHSRRIKTELLKQMESFGDDNIVVLCTTNCPWELDPAFLRRFQRKIFVGLPNKEARCQILGLHLGSAGVAISGEDMHTLSECTEGYSGSDLAHVASEALMRPLRELEGAGHWLPTAGGLLQPCSANRPGALQMSFTDLSPHQVLLIHTDTLKHAITALSKCAKYL
jgi:vacuolar protein-sorting-associated protein 4